MFLIMFLFTCFTSTCFFNDGLEIFFLIKTERLLTDELSFFDTISFSIPRFVDTISFSIPRFDPTMELMITLNVHMNVGMVSLCMWMTVRMVLLCMWSIAE